MSFPHNVNPSQCQSLTMSFRRRPESRVSSLPLVAIPPRRTDIFSDISRSIPSEVSTSFFRLVAMNSRGSAILLFSVFPADAGTQYEVVSGDPDGAVIPRPTL